MINPSRFPLQAADFSWHKDGAIHIFEAQEAIIDEKNMVRVCSLLWTDQGLYRLRAAVYGDPPCPIELAVDCAGHNVSFTVYIAGHLQSPGTGTGFDVDYNLER